MNAENDRKSDAIISRFEKLCKFLVIDSRVVFVAC